MTRVTRDRILKDANENISDHLRNHIHLTNCIHLKNMHKHSPILGDKSLMRNLVVLQRSRSLRDPSTSPPSWRSPSVVDLLLKKQENETVIGNGSRSVGIECSRDITKMIGSSPNVVGSFLSKGASGKLSRNVDRTIAGSDDSISSGGHDSENSSERGKRLAGDENIEGLSGSHGFKNKGTKHKDHIKTLSEQLHEISEDTDDAASTHADIQRRCVQGENLFGETQPTISRHSTGLNRGKRRKFRGSRTNKPLLVTSKHASAHSEMSVASNSLIQGTFHQKHNSKAGGEDYVHRNVREAPKHGCGVPFNWSRIHNRGRSFLDIAGRSFSCGLHESVLKKGGSGSRRNVPDLPMMLDTASSSAGPDPEALPLLIDASGSQGSTENAAWFPDYSGELGIFAQDLLNRELDSDLASEARSGERHKVKGFENGRHQSLTQKYMPKTFRDLVGQTLVAQALSNAIMKRKVGLLYVFYGPHGTGKTTTARVFARALNCQSVQQHLKPCGVCTSCVAHESGKSRTIKEIGPVSSFDCKGIMNLLESMIVPQMSSQYRISIFDDCDTLSPDCWSSIVKVIDRAPRRVVLILICSSLDVLPHIIISRCQKFFFPKMKEADIIYTLQWIASKEDLEIDKDALKVIASKSDGSLRDAEMTLEQLSLLGQRISVSLVQELVGLISDEKLVDLLDLALSADTVNTVKHLREIMESGVEPLALMSQLATAITDILAGGYDFSREGRGRKFFRRPMLSKEDMEKLRQALKTLSEAEKQLRMSNDRLTWLTAVLLQLAPDQQYLLPNSSAENSFTHTPTDSKNPAGRLDRPRKSSCEMTNNGRGPRTGHVQAANSAQIDHVENKAGPSIDQRSRAITSKLKSEVEEIWFDVLDKIRLNSIRQFLLDEGKLISINFSAAPTVQLLFSSQLAKSKADKFKTHILQAFEYVLGSPVTIEIRFESSKDPIVLPATDRDASNHIRFKSSRAVRSEIVEHDSSSKETGVGLNIRNDMQSARQAVEVIGSKHGRNVSFSDSRGKLGDRNQSLSLVRGKVSLAHVIQQAEGYSQQNGWSKCKAVSIAEKLEQDNLRLEPRSRSLLCWRTSRGTRQKHSRLKVRTRKPHTLLKFVSCGRCLSGRSTRSR